LDYSILKKSIINNSDNRSDSKINSKYREINKVKNEDKKAKDNILSI
jgi:hypothetical protein